MTDLDLVEHCEKLLRISCLRPEDSLQDRSIVCRPESVRRAIVYHRLFRGKIRKNISQILSPLLDFLQDADISIDDLTLNLAIKYFDEAHSYGSPISHLPLYFKEGSLAAELSQIMIDYKDDPLQVRFLNGINDTIRFYACHHPVGDILSKFLDQADCKLTDVIYSQFKYGRGDLNVMQDCSEQQKYFYLVYWDIQLNVKLLRINKQLYDVLHAKCLSKLDTRTRAFLYEKQILEC